MDAARIELYVAERAVARHEAEFQRWVEKVTAPLRYVCIGDGPATQFCTTPIGTYIESFGDGDRRKGDKAAPGRKVMSAFSGFSVARDQSGVWFREGTGAPEEDRNTIYTFLVARELGEVAYYAIRERLAKTILRQRNEQAVMLSRVLDDRRGLETELVTEKESEYGDFARAFEAAANEISRLSPARIDLAWKLLHLFQLLQRDLMAWAYDAKKSSEARREIYEPLFRSFCCIVERVFEGSILDRMSTVVFVTWVRMAGELHKLGDSQAAPAVKRYIEQALKASILEIADSLWRFQGHNLAGARDLLDSDSCGVEAFTFVAALNTCHYKLGLRVKGRVKEHEETLRQLWTDPTYLPHLLLRDWRGLSYSLNARNRKELAAAFALHTVDAIDRSGISDERTWYRSIKEMFPGG
jgi:hypothetical protein